MIFDTENLREWFLSRKRNLPWRKNNTPYSVLISEIMLQQTQVSVVIPYYLKWMKKFPNFESLASSTEEDVLKLWEGLGYYSRAKNLKKAAEYICNKWNGNIPSDQESLNEIPGVGPYTSGAIRAFAFQKKSAAVDGNVMRVLCRYFGLNDDISKAKTHQKLRMVADSILPDFNPWDIAEGLIELGALICKKSPLCRQCPIQSNCHAYLNQLTSELPVKTRQVAIIKLFRLVTILFHKGKILIRRVPNGEIMAGLHEFPYFESDDKEWKAEILQDIVEEKFLMKTDIIRRFPIVNHSFTRFRAELTPIMFQCLNFNSPLGYFWASKEELSSLAFSSGHRRILRLIS